MFPQIGHRSRAGCRDDYPFDLDASERFVRPKTGIDVFPMPNNAVNFAKLGCISGFMPQLDAFIWAQMYGKNGYGPTNQPFPVNLQWQMTVPGLSKVTS
jgi:hypothetical protein